MYRKHGKTNPKAPAGRYVHNGAFETPITMPDETVRGGNRVHIIRYIQTREWITCILVFIGLLKRQVVFVIAKMSDNVLRKPWSSVSPSCAGPNIDNCSVYHSSVSESFGIF